MMQYQIWDFIDSRGRNVIREWVNDERLTKRDRAALNQKIKRLAQIDFELARNTKLLAGPIYRHIYKLVIHGDVMLRPMLCKGPIGIETEYSLLLGAIERGGKLPAGSAEQAEENREVIIRDHQRRIPHEFIP